MVQIYWRGLDITSQSPVSSDIENDKLYSVLTSRFMYDVITEFIPEPYFFNDQIVVKQPHESFLFEEYRDNQYNPISK